MPTGISRLGAGGRTTWVASIFPALETIPLGFHCMGWSGAPVCGSYPLVEHLEKSPLNKLSSQTGRCPTFTQITVGSSTNGWCLLMCGLRNQVPEG
jgi:hypothetical protein